VSVRHGAREAIERAGELQEHAVTMAERVEREAGEPREVLGGEAVI
jgi:hypothetical protein